MSGLKSNSNLIVVLGPTATGKTHLSALLAKNIGGEIISADSRQVYRRMNIGTGKDINEYTIEGKTIRHHLIDICEPGTKYNVYEFQKDFFSAFQDIKNRNNKAILSGGTGMYIESVTQGYKLISVPVNQKLRVSLQGKSLEELESILSEYKRLHNKTDTDTIKRAIRAIEIEEHYSKNEDISPSLPKINPIYIGVKVNRDLRRTRITMRLQQRLKEGMIDEVKQLLNEGIAPEDLTYYGLEYKYITLFLTQKMSYEEMVDKLNISIHQFAKRQMTWFRKMERGGIKIQWIDGEKKDEAKIKQILEFLK